MTAYGVRVSAPHFVAGIEVRDGAIIYAAPILRWSVGKGARWFADYCKRNGWATEVLR